MRKVKYSVTRVTQTGKVRTTKHNTRETAFKEAGKSLNSLKTTAEIQRLPATTTKAKKRRVRRRRRSA